MKQVLIVRHGPGRGRDVPTLDSALAFIKSENPSLFSILRFYETGSECLSNLDKVSSVWFWLADPLRERYPDCFADASSLLNKLSAHVRLVNPPASLSNTIKSVQAKIWKEAGFRVARHASYSSRPELEYLVKGFRFPAIIRDNQTHSIKGLYVLRSPEELRKISPHKIKIPGTLVEFIDTRIGYAESQPGTVWSRFYHKKRSIVLGDQVDRRSVLFSPSPIVKLRSCVYQGLMRHYMNYRFPSPVDQKAKWEIPVFESKNWRKQCIDADNTWWRNGDHHDKILVKATKSLGLTCAAIDYSTKSNGQVVLWEANPYFHMPGPKNYILPRERHFDDRRLAANKAIARFLFELAN